MELFLAITALVAIPVILLMIELDVEFKSPKVQRVWKWVALSTLGGVVLWLIILIGFIKPPR